MTLEHWLLNHHYWPVGSVAHHYFSDPILSSDYWLFCSAFLQFICPTEQRKVLTNLQVWTESLLLCQAFPDDSGPAWPPFLIYTSLLLPSIWVRDISFYCHLTVLCMCFVSIFLQWAGKIPKNSLAKYQIPENVLRFNSPSMNFYLWILTHWLIHSCAHFLSLWRSTRLPYFSNYIIHIT